MEDVESFRGERCGIDNCRSRRYHQNDEGTYECENGHVHPQLRVQGEDEDAFRATSGRVTRTDSVSTASEKISRHYQGKKGFELFLQCYQLLLRKQCSFLVKSKGFPDEIESVVRDLWTLRLQAFPRRIDEINTIDSDSESRSEMFSSQSDDDTSNAGTTSGKGSATPRLIETLALLYLAGLSMRLPVMPVDIYRWALSGELLYYEARKSTPESMLARLPSYYHVSLEANDILSLDSLARAVKNLVFFYRRDMGMQIPALNFTPLLLRCLEELALPLPVYAAVKWLRGVCDFGLDYAAWEANNSRKVTQASVPSAQLAALIVVATKLLYPFDDLHRRLGSAADQAVLSVDWAKWVEIKRGGKSKAQTIKAPLTFADAMAIREEDVGEMSRRRLDQYMAFYAETWTSDHVDDHSKDADARKELLQTFPMPVFTPHSHQPPTQKDERKAIEQIKAIMAGMKVNAIGDVEGLQDAPQLGTSYKQWRSEEDLNSHARSFCEVVSEVLGVPVPKLIRATFYTERTMARWHDR